MPELDFVFDLIKAFLLGFVAVAAVVWLILRRVALKNTIDRNDLFLMAALVLITAALWPLVQQLALIVSGLVLLWLAVPARVPFIRRSAADERRKR